jgi:hypothetical protein
MTIDFITIINNIITNIVNVTASNFRKSEFITGII